MMGFVGSGDMLRGGFRVQKKALVGRRWGGLTMSASAAPVVLCPGQGAQAVGMGAAWKERSPAAGKIFQRADRVLGDRLGMPLSEIIFAGPKVRKGWEKCSASYLIGDFVGSRREEERDCEDGEDVKYSLFVKLSAEVVRIDRLWLLTSAVGSPGQDRCSTAGNFRNVDCELGRDEGTRVGSTGCARCNRWIVAR